MENIITWFEIPVTDMNRARTFYSEILQMKLIDIEEGGYSMVMFPFTGENVSGALVEAEDQNAKPSADGVHIFLNAGDSLQEALSRVKKAGGEIVTEKLEIESGVVASVIDTEGNKVGLYARA